MSDSAIVEDYLHRLADAALVLPPERRHELVQEIRDHIRQASAAGDTTDRASLLQVLNRLGDPHDIVAAARDEDSAPPVVLDRRRGIGVEMWAASLLTFGSLVPLLGWLAGAVLLWSSSRWTVREKVLATLIVPGGPFGVVYLILSVGTGGQTCTTEATPAGQGQIDTAQTCTSSGSTSWIVVVLLVLAVVLPFVVNGVLLRRAAERR